MIFQVNNLIFDFTFETPDNEFIGMGRIQFQHKDMVTYLVDMFDFDAELLRKYEEDEIGWDDFKEEAEAEIDDLEVSHDGDYVVQWLEDDFGDAYTSRNSDFCILFFSVHELEEFEEDDITHIKYFGENPFWVFHDICHSRHDVQGSQIYVDANVEENRILGGMELAAEHGMIAHCNGDLLRACNEAMKERWGNPMDMDHLCTTLNNLSN